MLSVCIPVYNFNIVSFVETLSRQAVEADILFEILIIDDGSGNEYKIVNRKAGHFEGVRYKELPANTGRSKIRNLLAREAVYEYLLFVDCDAQAPTDFIKKYLENLRTRSIISGGVSYSIHKPAKEYLLRWRYGHKRECPDADTRNKLPYHSFKTFNFLIPKDIFDKITFDEKITGYGHEDTLFGLELKKLNIPVYHIDNPLIHLGLETNEVFLEKTKTGIRNLYQLDTSESIPEELSETVNLLRFFHRLPSWSKKLLTIKFWLFGPFIHMFLKQGKSPMGLFDLYKLGYLCMLYSNRNKK